MTIFRKSRFSILCIVFALLLTCCSCSRLTENPPDNSTQESEIKAEENNESVEHEVTETQNNSEESDTISFITYADSTEDVFSGIQVDWSLKDNKSTISSSPLFTAFSDGDYYHYDLISCWNGRDSVLTYPRYKDAIKLTDTSTLKNVYTGIPKTVIGKDYNLSIDDSYKCVITDEKGEEHDIGRLDFKFEGKDYDFYFFASSTRINNFVTIVYYAACNDSPDKSVFLYANVDLTNNTVSWKSSEKIDRDYNNELYNFYGASTFVVEKMYFPSENRICYLDTSNGKIVKTDLDLGEVAAKAVSDMERSKAFEHGDWEFAPCPCGSVGDVIVYNVGFYGSGIDDKSTLYIAVKDNTVLGALEMRCEEGKYTMNVYDKNMAKTQTIDLADYSIDSMHTVFPRQDMKLG